MIQTAWPSIIDELAPLFTDDLRSPQYQGNPNQLTGHCYVFSEVLYHLIGKKGLKPMFIRHEGQPHWFLFDEWTGAYIDPTASQFETPVPYLQAKGKGFRTRFPSRRAQTVLDKLNVH